MSILIFSWNVNGIRALMSKFDGGLPKLFSQYNADLYCFQETKTGSKRLLGDDIIHVPGYESFWSFCTTKQGYSGVVTYARKGSTLGATIKFKNENLKNFDTEGRCVVTDHGLFVLVNVYFPNGRRSLEYRLSDLVSQGKHVIITGDINIAHQPIDVHDPDRAESENQCCFFPESRKWFSGFLSQNFTDTFRHFHPTEQKYTCWNKTQARMLDHGCRIDYHLVSAGLLSAVTDCDMYGDQFGSDHCPVFLRIRGVLPGDIPPTVLSSDFRRERQLSMRNFFRNGKGGVSDPTGMNVDVTDIDITNTVVMDAVVRDGAVTDTIVKDAAVIDTVLTDGVVTDTIDVAVTDAVVTDGAVTDTIVKDGVVIDTIVKEAAVTDTVIKDLAVIDTIVKEVAVIDTVIKGAVVANTIVIDTDTCTVVKNVEVTDTNIMEEAVTVTNTTVTNMATSVTDRRVTNRADISTTHVGSHKKGFFPNEVSKRKPKNILSKKRKLPWTGPSKKKAKLNPEPHGNPKQVSLMSFFSLNPIIKTKKT